MIMAVAGQGGEASVCVGERVVPRGMEEGAGEGSAWSWLLRAKSSSPPPLHTNYLYFSLPPPPLNSGSIATLGLVLPLSEQALFNLRQPPDLCLKPLPPSPPPLRPTSPPWAHWCCPCPSRPSSSPTSLHASCLSSRRAGCMCVCVWGVGGGHGGLLLQVFTR